MVTMPSQMPELALDTIEEDPMAMMPSARLEEGVPLLGKMVKTPTNSARTGTWAHTRKEIMEKGLKEWSHECYDDFGSIVDKSQNGKMLLYDHDSLLTAKSMASLSMSAFTQRPVLLTLAYCVTICTIMATAVFFIPRARKFDTQKFEAFGGFLKIFIGFMLGTYVTSAFTRWWFSVSAFEDFLGNVQQMVFMLHTIRGRPAWRKAVEKYCVCSGYILSAEVRNVHQCDEANSVDIPKLLEWLGEKDFLSEEEVDMLKTVHSPFGVCCRTRAIWTWIGEMVSHPEVEEGLSVPPPLLVRTVVLCQACIEKIEVLKMNVSMQMPFMYAHLLSMLVHANNTIVAISCGIALGSALNEVRCRSEQMSGVRDTERSELGAQSQLYGASQIVAMQIVTVLLIPMCYVAFLHIAHMLCYPFGDQCYHLPTETIVARLQVDLQQMSDQREYFREKHQEWKAMESARMRKKKGNDDEIDDDADDAGGDCD